MKLAWAPCDPPPEMLAEIEAEMAERKRWLDEHDELIYALRPLVANTFLGGWWRGNRRFVGEFNVEEFWPEKADEPCFSNLRVTCPDCNRRFSPFRSRSLVCLNASHRWVGLDHTEPYNEYFCACGWCGGPMMFTIYFPQ